MKHKFVIPFIAAFVMALFFAPQSLEAQQFETLFDLGSFEETLFCAYSIHEEEIFDLGLDSNGAIVVNNTCNDADLTDFIMLKTKEFRNYSNLPKLELGEYVTQWCESLPEEILTALVKQENVKAAAQNNLCANADPFCTDNGLYEFPAGVDAGVGEPGPYYSCLGTRPNPAWYYMRILTPGDMDIYMFSTPQVDIDFCCWGPFDDPTEPCPSGLTRQKVVSCSYSTNWNETCQIRGAQEGEYYILLITNYSNRVCNINFSKTAGEASTDCNILPPLVSYDNPACVGADLHLYANGSLGDAFRWFQVGSNWVSNEQNPMRPNATLDMSGTYGCVISRNGQFSDTTYIEVVINQSIIYQRVVDTCNSFTWLGVDYTASGHYEEHLTTTAGCDSIIDLTLTLGYTPEFEIVGNHWPIGGSETYISVNEYTIGLENPLTQIDTVLWSVDCENWRIEPHGKGESCTIYIFSFLEEPVMLHATVINACGNISQEFFIQTSYFGIEETVENKGVMISPNPTDGEFTLHLDGWKGNITIELFDDQGRKVMQQSKESDNLQTICLKDCRKGLYYLRVTDDNRCVTDKLIIQ